MILNFLKRFGLPLTIFILALFVRTYHLEATMTFLEDEGRDMLISYRMLDTLRPVLLGPQTSTGDMYLGPFYYYFITPALALAGLSPLGPSFLIALTGAVTATLLYFLGRAWFSPLVGTTSAILYAFLPLPVVFTRNSWNPNLAPLIALILIALTVSLITRPTQTRLRYLALGAAAGILFQLHYMALLFLGGIGLTLLLFHTRRLGTLLKGSLLSLVTFLILLSPFILFEFRNDFVNSRAITRFISARDVHNIRYRMPVSLWADKVGSTTTRLLSSLYGRDALTVDPARNVITISVLTLLVLTMIVAYRSPSLVSTRIYILSLLFFVPLGVAGIYQENIHLHYLGFFFPLIYLLTSAALSLPKLRFPTLILLLALFVYSLPQLVSYLSSTGTNQLRRSREVVDYITASAAGREYNLISSSQTNTTPYQYYAAISTNPPKTTPSNLVYLVCQGSECSPDDINTPFLFITGPAHPSLEKYIGHPLYYQFEGKRQVLSNVHVSHGVWVAQLLVE